MRVTMRLCVQNVRSATAKLRGICRRSTPCANYNSTVLNFSVLERGGNCTRHTAWRNYPSPSPDYYRVSLQAPVGTVLWRSAPWPVRLKIERGSKDEEEVGKGGGGGEGEFRVRKERPKSENRRARRECYLVRTRIKLLLRTSCKRARARAVLRVIQVSIQGGLMTILPFARVPRRLQITPAAQRNRRRQGRASETPRDSALISLRSINRSV